MFYNGRKGAASGNVRESVVTVDNDRIALQETSAAPGASNNKTLILGDEYHDAL